MDQYRTTVAVQRYLDELAGVTTDTPAEPIVRALLARAVNRLHLLCKALLYRSYPRLTRGPLNLSADELLGGVVERLIKAMREVRPGTVRQFFALANQHMRWEINDLARRLDHRMSAERTIDLEIAAPDDTSQSGVSHNTLRILKCIDELPEEEREAFNLIRIQGLTKVEASLLLGVSEKTVQRRLSRGVLRLTEMLGDIQPMPTPLGQDSGNADPPSQTT